MPLRGAPQPHPRLRVARRLPMSPTSCPGSWRTMTSLARTDDALQEMARSMRQKGTRSCRLVQAHIRDLSTSNSQPGEFGSKPCSISQRETSRLRSDHHARITSRSTSVP